MLTFIKKAIPNGPTLAQLAKHETTITVTYLIISAVPAVCIMAAGLIMGKRIGLAKAVLNRPSL